MRNWNCGKLELATCLFVAGSPGPARRRSSHGARSWVDELTRPILKSLKTLLATPPMTHLFLI